MSSNRTHNRAFEKAKQAFFEEGKRLDSEGSPAADCWICHKRIDYSVPPGTTGLENSLYAFTALLPLVKRPDFLTSASPSSAPIKGALPGSARP